MTLFQPFEALRPMVKQGVLGINSWEEASGLDPEAVHETWHTRVQMILRADPGPDTPLHWNVAIRSPD